MFSWPRLIVKLGGEVLQTEELRESILSIGRLPDNSLNLVGIHVSDHHAQLRREPDRITITDLESLSGTFVDGLRIPPGEPHRLFDGSEIQIGLYLLTFRAAQTDPDADHYHAAASAVPLMPEGVAGDISVSQGSPRPLLSPGLLPVDAQSKYLDHLPVIFHDSDLFRRMLLIFENIWELGEQRQEFLEMYLDPRTCPTTFLPWIASWFDVSIDPHWPESRVRQLLLQVIQLYRWRGTKYGLSRMLEVCAGVTSEITTSTTSPFVLHITIQVAGGHGADMLLVEELVRAHKPAHVGYVLEVRA